MSHLFTDSPHQLLPFRSEALASGVHLVRGRHLVEPPASEDTCVPAAPLHFYTSSKRGYDLVTAERGNIPSSEVTLVGPQRCRRRWSQSRVSGATPPGMPCVVECVATMNQTYLSDRSQTSSQTPETYLLLDSLPTDLAEAHDPVTAERLVTEWLESLFTDNTSNITLVYTRDWAENTHVKLDDGYDTYHHPCTKHFVFDLMNSRTGDYPNTPLYDDLFGYERLHADVWEAYHEDSQNKCWMTLLLIHTLHRVANNYPHQIRIHGYKNLSAWWYARFPRHKTWQHHITQTFVDASGNGVVPYTLLIRPTQTTEESTVPTDTCEIHALQHYSDGRTEFHLELPRHSSSPDEMVGYDWIALVPPEATHFTLDRFQGELSGMASTTSHTSPPREMLHRDDTLIPLLEKCLHLYRLDKQLQQLEGKRREQMRLQWYRGSESPDDTMNPMYRLECLVLPLEIGEFLEATSKPSLYGDFLKQLQEDMCRITEQLKEGTSRPYHPSTTPVYPTSYAYPSPYAYTPVYSPAHTRATRQSSMGVMDTLRQSHL